MEATFQTPFDAQVQAGGPLMLFVFGGNVAPIAFASAA
jgi:hypothetical protein